MTTRRIDVLLDHPEILSSSTQSPRADSALYGPGFDFGGGHRTICKRELQEYLCNLPGLASLGNYQQIISREFGKSTPLDMNVRINIL